MPLQNNYMRRGIVKSRKIYRLKVAWEEGLKEKVFLDYEGAV